MKDVSVGGVVEIALGVAIALIAVKAIEIVFAKYINKATDHFEKD